MVICNGHSTVVLIELVVLAVVDYYSHESKLNNVPVPGAKYKKYPLRLLGVVLIDDKYYRQHYSTTTTKVYSTTPLYRRT
jgi:hypothetical protein